MVVHVLAQLTQRQTGVAPGVLGDERGQHAVEAGVLVVEGLEVHQRVEERPHLPLVMPMENSTSVV